MSYYQFNRQEILQKNKEKLFLRKNCWVLFTEQRNNKKKTKNRYRNLTDEEKQAKKNQKYDY